MLLALFNETLIEAKFCLRIHYVHKIIAQHSDRVFGSRIFFREIHLPVFICLARLWLEGFGGLAYFGVNGLNLNASYVVSC